MRFLLALPLLWAPLSAQTLYEVTDLGAPGGTNSWAQSINDAGATVFYVETIYPVGSQFAGWLWEDGTWTDLGSLGGNLVFPLCLNNSRLVGGYTDLGSLKIHGFSWDAGVMSDLGAVYRDFSRAQAVNDRGWFAGVTMVPIVINFLYAHRPVIWAGGNMITLSSFGGWLSEAKGINDVGTVVGFSHDLNSVPLPFQALPDGTFVQLPGLSGGAGEDEAGEQGGAAGVCGGSV